MPGKKKMEIETTFRAIDRMNRPLGRMRRGISRFSQRAVAGLKRVDRVMMGMAKFMAAGFTAALGIATIAIFKINAELNEMADHVDNIAKKSRAIDFPIEEFQEWTFVAEQSGVEADKFEKGLVTFNKRLGKLKGGFGPLTTALKKTNPELAKTLKQTTNSAEAFDVMVKAIREVKGADMKSMLADAAFGLTKMSLIAGNSAEQIDALRKEMRENGVVTADQALEVEAYNDSMNSLGLTVDGFKRGVLLPLIPMLTEASKHVRAWFNANKDIIKSKIVEFGRSIVDNWSEIVDWAKKIGKGIVVFAALAGAVKILIGIMTVLNIVMTANPIGLIVAGVILLIAQFTLLAIYAEEVVAWFDKIPAPIKAIMILINPFIGLVLAFVKIAAKIKKNWGPIKEFFIDLWEKSKEAFEVAEEFIKSAAVSVVNSWIDVKNFFIDLWNGIRQVFVDTVNFLMTTGPISWIIAAVALIKQNWEPITAFFSMVFGAIANVVDVAVTAIKEFFSPLVEFFKETWNKISGVSNDAVDGFKESGFFKTLLDIVDEIKNEFDDLVEFFKKIWKEIISIFDVAAAKIKGIAQPLIDIIDDFSAAKNKLIGEEIGFLDDPEKTERDNDRAVKDSGGGIFPEIITPSEIIARSIEEKKETKRGELVIKDETGRAELSDDLGGTLALESTGGF